MVFSLPKNRIEEFYDHLISPLKIRIVLTTRFILFTHKSNIIEVFSADSIYSIHQIKTVNLCSRNIIPISIQPERVFMICSFLFYTLLSDILNDELISMHQ